MNSYPTATNGDIFTVIVLCYNNEKYLHTCLDSILVQTYPLVQIIVADDCSLSFDTNMHLDYIQKKKNDNISEFIVYQNPQNYGTVANINTALQKATGKYIKIIAADDALANEYVLENAAKELDISTDGIITGDVIKCDDKLKNPVKYPDRLQHLLNSLPPKDVFKRLCVHNDIIAGGVFFDSRFFKKYGLFDQSYRLLEDWPTWLKITRKGCKIRYCSFDTIKYRSDGGVGTGTNTMYMADKKRVLEKIIKPEKSYLGFNWYLKARLAYFVINSSVTRKIYSILFRKGK